ncbi:MAG TPA: D-glycero-beta-D-manno-heptose-1,7-bisphosphate 7-phosphatase [Gammaproteobacteria bacterium]|nr:D-glycero-beta-D-manno-heptose-1,7-bisphosphate 7-phosphatase [Gammaproteobacteria bacterium]
MKIIVLDRDGVINEDSDDYIKSPEEWSPVPGSLEAIAALHVDGYKVAVATNQSGLGRMLFDEIALANIHQKMCSMVEDCGGFIEGVFYCPHLPNAGCDCRKPKTGLLQCIEDELLTSLTGQYFVGDSLKDLQAARAFSMQPVLVRTGKGRLTESRLYELEGEPVPVFDNLAQFVEIGLPRTISGNHV